MSARQPKSELNKVDEIKVQWKDRAIISDFIEDHPDKKIILDVPAGETDFDFNLLYHCFDIVFNPVIIKTSVNKMIGKIFSKCKEKHLTDVN